MVIALASTKFQVLGVVLLYPGLRFALCGCLVCKLFGSAVVCGVEVLGEGSNDTP